MLRILTFLVLIASYASRADDIYRNCSGVEFCNSLRNQQPLPSSSLLTPWLTQLTQNDNIISIPLNNSDNQELKLEISLLTNRTARIKVSEKVSQRYELADVLDKEPTKLDLAKVEPDLDIITIRSTDSLRNPHKVVVHTDPFYIEFYYDENTLQSTFKGENLIFLQNSQSYAFRVDFNDATRLYGLHHHAVELELPTTATSNSDPFRFRNSDVYNNVGSTKATYGSVPAVYGHSARSTSGIFLHNAAEQWIDVSNDNNSPSVYFMVERAALDLFVLLGNTPRDVVRQFVEITGRSHMPQLWTLGYHQCRYSYWTQEDAKDVVAQMDAHDFPMDALWLDIDYTDGYRYFTWNPINYTDPEELQRNLTSTNRKLVTILDPHIKVDENYPVYAGAKGKYFVKNPDGTDFEGVCWPNVSSYIDFLDPAARDYYASWYSYEKFNGSTPTLAGIWNDMNEPSVFNDTTEKTMPFDAVHFGNVQHGDIHNIYGFLQTKATHQGLMQRDNGTKRPFILTRSSFAGSQRYAAMWTGDTTADWPYLQVSHAECILSNLIGLPFCGSDIGGFNGNPEVELVQRWYQAGIWYPFYRGHSSIDTERREPYLFNSTVQAVIRSALRTRYKHIPVWYTLFFEYTRTGDPLIRPLFYEYPGVVDKANHILLGSDILARPVVQKGATNVSVTFPGTSYWYRVDDDSFELYESNVTRSLPVDITTSPYFYRGGSIIARKDTERQSTTDMLQDPYSIYINLDADRKATGKVYIDDFTSFNYQNEKQYSYISLTYIPNTNSLRIETIDGSTQYPLPIEKIVINGKNEENKEVYTRTIFTTLADGKPLKDANIISKLATKKRVVLQLQNKKEKISESKKFDCNK